MANITPNRYSLQPIGAGNCGTRTSHTEIFSAVLITKLKKGEFKEEGE